jgi:dTDP-4-amino-4,6-dideoxygalactose transaminase
MGEGGGITTNDDALSKRLKKLCSHSIVREPGDFINTELALDDKGSSNPWYYEMQELGFNFRASDIHCALGVSQLNKLNKYAARRKKLAALYDKILAPQAPAIRPIERMAGCNPAWHLYVILVDFKKTRISRAELIRQLYDEGIGTQVHYIPVHKQPYYQNLYGDVSLHGAEQYYEQCLSLPLFPGMTEVDVERVARKLNIIINGD